MQAIETQYNLASWATGGMIVPQPAATRIEKTRLDHLTRTVRISEATMPQKPALPSSSNGQHHSCVTNARRACLRGPSRISWETQALLPRHRAAATLNLHRCMQSRVRFPPPPPTVINTGFQRYGLALEGRFANRSANTSNSIHRFPELGKGPETASVGYHFPHRN